MALSNDDVLSDDDEEVKVGALLIFLKEAVFYSEEDMIEK